MSECYGRENVCLLVLNVCVCVCVCVRTCVCVCKAVGDARVLLRERE